VIGWVSLKHSQTAAHVAVDMVLTGLTAMPADSRADLRGENKFLSNILSAVCRRQCVTNAGIVGGIDAQRGLAP
jgi:hypothetical protein